MITNEWSKLDSDWATDFSSLPSTTNGIGKEFELEFDVYLFYRIAILYTRDSVGYCDSVISDTEVCFTERDRNSTNFTGGDQRWEHLSNEPRLQGFIFLLFYFIFLPTKRSIRMLDHEVFQAVLDESANSTYYARMQSARERARSEE